MYQVLRLRIYRKHNAKLNKLASVVNFVWNYVNDLCLQMWRRKRVFPSAYDVAEYTKGAGEELGLHSQTIQFIGEKHHQSRKQHKKVEPTAKMPNVKHWVGFHLKPLPSAM